MTEAKNTIELKDSERQPCEVWTRVMGYHRPVQSFNIGKKGDCLLYTSPSPRD
mgnify:CR=1 FL=1